MYSPAACCARLSPPGCSLSASIGRYFFPSSPVISEIYENYRGRGRKCQGENICFCSGAGTHPGRKHNRAAAPQTLRGKHQAFPEDKSGSEKPPRNLLSTCSGRESSGRMSRPYGAVSQSVASLSGGSFLTLVREQKHIIYSAVKGTTSRIASSGVISLSAWSISMSW